MPRKRSTSCPTDASASRLNVVIDWELQAWVMGFGPAARVITPEAFAKRIVESLEETRATYLRTE